MAVVKIFELDSIEAPVSVLETGEYIFGRGPLLKCTDRRVSRKHGVITVSGQTATITSTHQNPCFYQAAGSSTITILPKDNPIHINDGDKFALLADQFWFRVAVTKNGSGVLHKATGSCSSGSTNVSSNCIENGRLSPLPFTCAPVSNDLQGDSNFQQSTQVGQEVESNENFIRIANNSDSPATQKRAHEADAESSSNKKLKVNNVEEAVNELFSLVGDLQKESLDKPDDNDSDQEEAGENELFSVLGDLQKESLNNTEDKDSDQEETGENELLPVLGDLHNESLNKSEDKDSDEELTIKCEGKKDKEVLSDVEEEANNKKATSEGKNKKEVMSESDDDNIVVKVKPDTPKKNRYKWKKETAVAGSSQSAQADADLKSMLDSSDEDNENQPNDLTAKANMNSSSKNFNVKELNISNDDTSAKEDNKEEKDSNDDTSAKEDNKEEKDSKASGSDKDDKTNEDPNAAGTSGSKQKKTWRDHCWYGLGCYRKSASHTAEYSHPGDSDFDTDPEDDRPVCAFGAACYRRNKDHRQQYKHPSKPQKPAGGGKRPKKQNKKPDAPKKRTARKQYNQSSDDDDYDLQDPFIGDSGTEYEATSSDDDSESEWSGASEDETKRLLKEAKRFTNSKKKDKNDDDDD